MNTVYYTMPLYQWILIAALLLSQSTYLFLDARKRKASPWFWGLIGLIQCPMPILFYYLTVRRPYELKKKRREKND